MIIDETPSAVMLSSFDGVRREIARITLERLIADGRIHPALIEETYEQAKAQIDERIVEEGERAMLEARVHGLDPELVKLLGKLKFRTSYGQNVLDHLIECSELAGLIAAELGASVETARRAALLHDIGKAVSHEIEGPHAQVGARIAQRHGEPEAVTHAMEAHHNEVEPRTVEAVIVQTADSLSGARPGARGDSLEEYVERLRELEEIAMRQEGVERVYAMRAGREIRVIVDPGQGGRRARRADLPRDRRGHRAGARVPRPGEDHGDPREPGDGLCELSRTHTTGRPLRIPRRMDKTLFFVFGIALVVSAVGIAVIGLRFENFPPTGVSSRAWSMYFVALVGATAVFAVLNARDEQHQQRGRGRRRDEHHDRRAVRRAGAARRGPEHDRLHDDLPAGEGRERDDRLQQPQPGDPARRLRPETRAARASAAPSR